MDNQISQMLSSLTPDHFLFIIFTITMQGPLVSPSIRCDDSSLVNIDADEYVQTLSYIGGHRRIGVTRSNCFHWKISVTPFADIELHLRRTVFYGDGCLVMFDGMNRTSQSILMKHECSNITSNQEPNYPKNKIVYVKFYPGANVIEGSFMLDYKSKTRASYGNQFESKDSSSVVLAVLCILITIVIVVGCTTLYCKQRRNGTDTEPRNKYSVDPVTHVNVNVL